MSEVRLQVKNLCKNFGITKAVQNVSFNVNKGEVHALIGENGSGKSTLTNMLTGIYSIGSGQFILDGKEIHPKNQVEANNEGVSIIVQELGTLSGLTVAENIFLGHEDQFVHFGIKNTNAMNKKATELLKQYGFDRIKAADMIDNYKIETNCTYGSNQARLKVIEHIGKGTEVMWCQDFKDQPGKYDQTD